MITYIRNLFIRERELNAKRAWRRGFNWAAGCLLGGVSPEQVRLRLDGRQLVDFDRGAEAACVKFEKLIQPAHDLAYITTKVPTLVRQLFAARKP